MAFLSTIAGIFGFIVIGEVLFMLAEPVAAVLFVAVVFLLKAVGIILLVLVVLFILLAVREIYK